MLKQCCVCLLGNTCRCVTAVCVSSFLFLLLQSFFLLTTATLQPEYNCKIHLSLWLPVCLFTCLSLHPSVPTPVCLYLLYVSLCIDDLSVCRYIVAESSRSARPGEVRMTSCVHLFTDRQTDTTTDRQADRFWLETELKLKDEDHRGELPVSSRGTRSPLTHLTMWAAATRAPPCGPKYYEMIIITETCGDSKGTRVDHYLSKSFLWAPDVVFRAWRHHTRPTFREVAPPPQTCSSTELWPP